MQNLEDQIERQAETIERQGILIEMLYQTLMPYGTDKVFTSPKSSARTPRKRSRSRTPPPAPRKERQYSDYKIHVIARSKGDIVPEDIIAYIDDACGITVTSCTVDASGFTACINCLNKDDQRFILEEKSSEIMGRFNLKALQKRMIYSR